MNKPFLTTPEYWNELKATFDEVRHGNFSVINSTTVRHIWPPVIFMESSEIPLRIRVCSPNDTLFEKRVF